jgi:hypothetical protein
VPGTVLAAHCGDCVVACVDVLVVTASGESVAKPDLSVETESV